jgi:chemotaxis protein CheC
MELSQIQKDALTELINIGYGRAAGALSELTGYRISLEVPNVAIHQVESIAPVLEKLLVQPVASVNQSFSGPLMGNALLLLDKSSALVLSRLLSESGRDTDDLDSNAREIITEVGNILLNACLGIFGNLLQIQVNFAVPRFQLETIPHILDGMAHQASEKLRFGLMVHTRFHVKSENVTGYMVIVLGISSLERLMLELDRWETRQLQ